MTSQYGESNQIAMDMQSLATAVLKRLLVSFAVFAVGSASVDGDDRVLLVSDKRQHEAVKAGRPYRQLTRCGDCTLHSLHEVVRQKEPELKEAVERLARRDIHGAVANLDQQAASMRLWCVKERLGASSFLRGTSREDVENKCTCLTCVWPSPAPLCG